MNILALSAHTDDAEQGAGGFLARAVERGDNVTTVAFSTGNFETGSNWDEYKQAADVLGIDRMDHRAWEFYYGTRTFPAQRQAILNHLVGMVEQLAPDLVLVPATTDIHQDHQVITAEAMRAFRTCSIIGYELPWCNYEFKPTMYVALTAEQMEKKRAALACYESQQSRHYFDDCVTNLARVRGMQIKVEFAEAFEVIRWVMK